MVVRLRLLSVGYSVEGWSDIVGCRVTRLVCRRKTAAACILGLLCVDMYRVVTGQEEEEKLLYRKLQSYDPLLLRNTYGQLFTPIQSSPEAWN